MVWSLISNERDGKTMNYSEYIECMDYGDINIHIHDEAILNKEVVQPILLISHNLSVTGAPIALLDMARILVKKNYQIFVVSLVDGDLLEEYLAIDSVVLVYSGRKIDMEHLKRIAVLFPEIVVNTLALAPLVRSLAPVSNKIFWWIHESNYFFLELDYDNIPEIPSLCILSASHKVSSLVSSYMGRSSRVLNVMVRDYYINNNLLKESKIVHFFWTGLINSNKMPELLLRAILELPESYRAYMDVTFCGDGMDMERKQLLRNCANVFPNIHYVLPMQHPKLIEWMRRMDVLVVCSREETTSLVAVEGLMLEKIVVCSGGCGIADHLNDGTDAFLFQAGDSEQLCQKIKYIIDHFDKLKEVRKAGRRIYEKYYSEETFEKQISDILGESNVTDKNRPVYQRGV